MNATLTDEILATMLHGEIARATLDKMIEPSGLSWRAAAVLCAIALTGDDGSTVTRLSQQFGKPVNATSQIVNRLCDKGLMYRERLATDERWVMLRLTTKGENLVLLISGLDLGAGDLPADHALPRGLLDGWLAPLEV
mgnify:CR=1 FL=1